jgi:uncharacterized protein YbaR (Trm112 family)
MQPINSPRDFEALLEAERAVLFVFFPWSSRSTTSLEVVTTWQKQAGRLDFPVFQLTPDGFPFTWQWLDTIFGEEPEEERPRGAVVWLRRGATAAFVPDAAHAGIKTLARITNDCFVLGKTHTRDSVALMQSEAAPFDPELLKILCCPETHQGLALADVSVLEKVNQRLAAGRLQNRAGQPVREKIEDGLVRADGRYLYPLRRNIPILLVDEAIPLAG